MFYLIGVNHDAQRHPPGAMLSPDQAKLEGCLIKAIEQYHPALIAVEENEETLVDRRNGVFIVYESIPRNVARERGIEHLFCEPCSNEKKRIGYMSKSQICLELCASGLLSNCPPGLEGVAAHAVEIAVFFPAREEHWIQKLRRYLQSEVILVLGEAHIESFCCRLKAHNVPSKVLLRGIGVSNAQNAESEAARRFPNENPQMFSAMIQQVKGTP
ncbi:MAG: hypothetical protein ABSE53_10595 [Terracidiphilus sp.]|jgi:hypothetical protein